MNGAEAIAALGSGGGAPLIDRLGNIGAVAGAQSSPVAGFDTILAGNLERMNEKLATADDLVRRFAVDDSIPVHQVTMALEEARLAVELAMQVRARLVETYREFMTMQL